ncbi:rRNA maturation RNase YbeY [Rhodovulum sp. DZ06]|uniref:rRNA maturation RNase YbeY n=1 Tax=Rhodovulum sp. DZ06 TaxID=3425126 RepID=UPI003D33350B
MTAASPSAGPSAAPSAAEPEPEPSGPAWPRIDLALEDPDWDALPDPEGLLARACAAGFAAAGLSAEGWSVSVLLASDAEIAALNLDHRGKPGPTNVLSWPAHDLAPEAEGDAPPAPPDPDPMPGEEAEEIGDLALAFGVCAAEARTGGLTLADHVTHLALHGTLHCLGYDHISDADAELMEGLESRAMLAMGLRDPYLPVD